LGDFDYDGIIDICFFQGDTIKVFNIHSEKLIQLKEKYLFVERTNNQHIYCIDLSKSNWFYKLNFGNCDSRKKFNFNNKNEYYY